MNVRTISMLGAAAILLSGCAIAAKVLRPAETITSRW